MPHAPLSPPEPGEYAQFYAGYIQEMHGQDAITALAQQLVSTDAVFAAIPADRGGYRYAPDKWTVRDVIGHLADTERILSTRLLRVARGDRTPMPSFDENAYAAAAGFDRLPLSELIENWRAVRLSTLALVRSLQPTEWHRRGTASGATVTARALAYIIAGHERHHLRVLRERYGIG
jgi:hypothetical protein